jgi:hypothetical protein
MLLDLDAIFDPDRRAVTIGSPADLPADWHEVWQERAAIMEYDGGLSPDMADHMALLDVVSQMRRAAVTVWASEDDRPARRPPERAARSDTRTTVDDRFDAPV